ncbi:MAG: hypothetical protein CMA58_00630 [Euryarchaeota archaeon]|nr:hypothetical protein [Euryarchaeota archaeon]
MNSPDGNDLMDQIAMREGDQGDNISDIEIDTPTGNSTGNINFIDFLQSFPPTQRIISLPDNIIMAAKSSWRGRERVLAAFAGVFLASLVITTVLAYSAGLSTAFLQGALENDVFDAQIAFDEDPGKDFRTNDSVVWESMCDELIAIEGISDCGIVYGRQGIRSNSIFDDSNFRAQPLVVESVTASIGDWKNVSWAYPEATEQGPPINDNRPIRFYGDGVWDGDLGERHARDILYGTWPSSYLDAENNRSIILPSQIASRAGVSINDTIDSLTFTFVTDAAGGSSLEDISESCLGELEVNFDSGFQFCRENITVNNLKVSAIYQEGFGNPTLLFNPVMVSDSVLNDSQKLILMDNDHGYLGVSVDRNLLPSSSTSAATSWLNDLKETVEEKEYADSSIKVRYNDVISGTIFFLNVFLGIIQVFDYILMIPIIILSFAVLIYGLVLSLEQRKREISIQRVIGGTESNLTGMILLELTVLGFLGWFTGYVLALFSVPLVLDAVGFMSFRSSGTEINPTLSFVSTFFIILITVGLTLLFGRTRVKDFLSIEIDEGVRKVGRFKKSRFWLHVLIFIIGGLSFLESWIQSNGGWGPFDSRGMFSNFILNALLLLFGPFMLWIGGALVLGRLGAAGPRIFTLILGRSPLVTDIRRGLKGSGSSESVNRLAVIMLLTLSIVTLAAVQGYTGTLVDERTTSAENGADLQVQFSTPMSETQARNEILLAIQRVDNSNIKDIDSMTSVGDIFTSPLGEDSRLRTWIVFDGHEETLLWDTQTIPTYVSDASLLWKNNWFTAGGEARRQLGLSSSDISTSITIEYTDYDFSFGPDGLDISTTVTDANIQYMGEHIWVPGLEPTQSSQVIVIGESTYKALVGNQTANSYTSNKWFFELCNQKDRGCADALRELSTEVSNVIGVSSSTDWPTVHEDNERKGGLIFGTPGLLSLQFVVASLASVASAFVFLSLVLTQRKRELAILQAIGASPNQIIRLVLFEIMAILLVSMGLGVILGLAIAESFNGFFGIFGFIFQIFLGESAPIDRELIWPWFDLLLVNSSVLFAVVLALLYTTRKALKSDLAIVLKGE